MKHKKIIECILMTTIVASTIGSKALGIANEQDTSISRLCSMPNETIETINYEESLIDLKEGKAIKVLPSKGSRPITAKGIDKNIAIPTSKGGELQSSIKVKAVGSVDYTIDNPYKNIDWHTANQLKANFHAHTNKSDGRDTIQEVLNKHSELGYDVLAITDHDRLTYPWNDPEKGDKNVIIPKGLNGIPGAEFSSKHHHINGFFLKEFEKLSTEEEVLRYIERQGAISHLNHPGRYDKSPMWYVNLYKQFPSLIGLEVINRDDRYPNDRKLWDNILTDIIGERNVWGFANADSHRLNQINTSYNKMLIDGEYTAEKLRRAMENGEFYFTANISAENNRKNNPNIPAPTISNIIVDNDKDTITIEGENIQYIEWIGSNSRQLGRGNSLNLKEVTSPNPYVRAVIVGEGGVSFTQPFKVTAQEGK